MKLYRETGTNPPLSSCLPLLLQMPIFFALFSVLRGIAMNNPQGVFTRSTRTWSRSSVRRRSSGRLCTEPSDASETANPINTRIVALILIILMTVTTFTTQRQLIVKNMSDDNPIVRQQKIMLYVFPVHVRGGRCELPDWCAHLLVHHEPVVDGPAVLRDPQQSAAEHACLRGWEQRKKEKEARKAVRRGEVASVDEAHPAGAGADQTCPAQEAVRASASGVLGYRAEPGKS